MRSASAVDELASFCRARDVDLDHITTLRKFEWSKR